MSQVKKPDEINLSEVAKVIGRYKKSILFITLIGTILATVFAYFSPNVYTTSTTVFIKSEKGGSDDFMSMALGAQSNNVDNEIEIIKSDSIISKALQNLDIATRYFTKHNYKTQELYKVTPFVVQVHSLSTDLNSVRFKLTQKSESTFLLTLEPSLKSQYLGTNKYPPYSELHKFGENISTDLFNINIEKIYKLKNEEYSFSISNQRAMIDFIQESLSVSTP